MTDAEIDKLDGLNLRRAVAEAVGWEWSDATAASDIEFRQRLSVLNPISWNDALAACEAAGFIELTLISVRSGSTTVTIAGTIEQRCIGSASGTTPESLCRALLKALAEKGGAA